MGVRKARRRQPQDCGISSWTLDGIEEELMVVLLVDPRGIGQQGQQVGSAVRKGTDTRVVSQPAVQIGGPRPRPVVERGVIAQRCRRHIAKDVAVETVKDAEPSRARRPAAR